MLTYNEPAAPPPTVSGSAETGSIQCPATPSATNPCTITVTVSPADVGSPSTGKVLEEVGSYAFAMSHPQNTTTNANALADNVPLEVDGACCFNYKVSAKRK